MSFLPPGISVLAASALDLLSPALFLTRNIGGFVADITIEEDHTDVVEITQHPVENGAAITDHAYKLPASVVITVGYSNSSYAALGNPFYVQQIYQQLLALQASLEPFSVTTGKRMYDNMLIHRLSTKTDEKTENAMIITVELQEILIVETQTVPSSDPSNMQDPASNAAVTDRGTVAATPYKGPNLNGSNGISAPTS